MQNLLIIEDNLIYSHFLVNSICKELNNIRLYSIVDTGKKALEIIKKRKNRYYNTRFETSRYKWNRYYKLYRRK